MHEQLQRVSSKHREIRSRQGLERDAERALKDPKLMLIALTADSPSEAFNTAKSMEAGDRDAESTRWLSMLKRDYGEIVLATLIVGQLIEKGWNDLTDSLIVAIFTFLPSAFKEELFTLSVRKMDVVDAREFITHVSCQPQMLERNREYVDRMVYLMIHDLPLRKESRGKADEREHEAHERRRQRFTEMERLDEVADEGARLLEELQFEPEAPTVGLDLGYCEKDEYGGKYWHS